MPLGRRVDRKYCRASCRTSAYRTRRRQTAPRRGARPGTAQQTTEPIPPELALALRQIPPAILTTLATWFGEHASSEQLTAARQRITELEQKLERQRSEHAAQQEAHRCDRERQREDEAEQRVKEQKTREAESRQRTEASSRQSVELQSALRKLESQLAQRTAELERERAEHKETRHIATQQNAEFGQHFRQAQEASQCARAEAESLRSQLAAAQSWSRELAVMLDAAEKRASERQQEHRKSSSTAKRAAQAPLQDAKPKRQPRASATRSVGLSNLTPPPPTPSLFEEQQEDELLALMMEYVTVRDALARKEGDQYLPDRTQRTIEAHALRMANKYRHEYHDRRDRLTDHRPAWDDYGHRLDTVSEALLHAEVRLKLDKLKRKLERSS